MENVSRVNGRSFQSSKEEYTGIFVTRDIASSGGLIITDSVSACLPSVIIIIYCLPTFLELLLDAGHGIIGSGRRPGILPDFEQLVHVAEDIGSFLDWVNRSRGRYYHWRVPIKEGGWVPSSKADPMSKSPQRPGR